MNKIDTSFDFRQDSKCGDPDADSQQLYEAHKTLWSKVLPYGKNLELKVSNNSRLLISSDSLDNLSSDRMCPHFDGKYKGKFDGWLSDSERDELQYKVRTIGGHIVFPAHQKNGFTINQARGVNSKICDRFDLTLECIRLFYRNENSPLYSALTRYKDFFDIFVNFKEYIEFFLLQDFIDVKDQVKFSLSFDGFNRSPLPQNVAEYRLYKTHTIGLITNRNYRIAKFCVT
jgi:hypothetical protein